MPDGFEPKTELERIYTLRDLMTACRQRLPAILRELDLILDDPEGAPGPKLQAADMILTRGFGKPRQHVVVHEPDSNNDQANAGVRIYIPYNNREELELPPFTIDQSGVAQETENIEAENNG